jgi:hypothetical protein
MTQADNGDSKQRDPADALADMADVSPEIVSPEEDDSEDAALDALTGLSDEPPDPEAVAEEGIAGDDEPPPRDEEVDVPTARPANAAQQAAYARAAKHRQAQDFKKMMIPLLGIVGAMVIAVGFLSAMFMTSDGMAGSRGTLMTLMFVSFPLGSVLLFGAWKFRRDTAGR